MPATISIPQLRAAVNGRVITPDDAAYDQARTVVYGGFDQRRPAAIIRAAGDTDVARVVAPAREMGLELAIRSGGHSPAGHSLSDGGIVLDFGTTSTRPWSRANCSSTPSTGRWPPRSSSTYSRGVRRRMAHRIDRGRVSGSASEPARTWLPYAHRDHVG
jgi:hypothetical protein